MAYNRRKRKVKKNIPVATAHIHATYNNTIVSICDVDGNVISWASAGTIGYKGSKKKTPFAAGMSAEAAGKAAMDQGVKEVEVFVKGLGAGRKRIDPAQQQKIHGGQYRERTYPAERGILQRKNRRRVSSAC